MENLLQGMPKKAPEPFTGKELPEFKKRGCEMRTFSFRSISVVLVALCAIGTANLAFAQGRSRTAAAPVASPAPAAAPAPATAGAPQIGAQPKVGVLNVTLGACEAEATSEASCPLTVSGGKAPYQFTITGDSGATVGETTGVVTFTPVTAGTFSFTVKVNDSAEPAVFMEKDFSVSVRPRTVSNADLEAKIVALAVELKVAKDNAIFAASGVTPNTNQKIRARVESFHRELHIGLGAALLVLVALLVFVLGPRVARLGVRGFAPWVAMLGFVFVLNAATPPAPPKVVCGDPTYNANFFPNDGKQYDVRCVGLRGAKVEFGSVAGGVFTADATIVVADAKPLPNGVSFKVAFPATVAVGYPAMTIDGKTVEGSLEVVSEATFTERDRAITSLRQVLGNSGSSDASVASDMRWLALFNAVCGTNPVGRCGDNLNGKAMFIRLQAARDQKQEDRVIGEVMVALATGVIEDTLKQPALETKVKRWAKDVADEQIRVYSIANPAGVSEVRAREIAGEEVKAVEGKVAEVVAGHNDLTTKVSAMGRDLEKTTTTANTAYRRATWAGVAVAGPTRGQRAAAKRRLADELK